MRPAKHEFIEREEAQATEAQATLLILEELGGSMRLLLESEMRGPLPAKMGLLLLQLAFAEILHGAAREVSAGAAEPSSPKLELFDG